jgi:hypothetical protein
MCIKWNYQNNVDMEGPYFPVNSVSSIATAAFNIPKANFKFL